jgi:hypothetical protein
LPINISKQAPIGAFVGTTDVQTLTNKIITDPTNTVRATQLATTGADVILSGGAPGSAGQVLTLTSPTAASWTSLPPPISPARTLYVYQGATNVSPVFSSLAAALVGAIALTPTTTNWVKIEMFSGTYAETIPLSVPQFVSITGLTGSQGDVIVQPVAPASATAVFILPGNTCLSGLIVNGYDGATGNASFGVQSVATVIGSTDIISSMNVVNCTSACVQVAGSTGVQYSKILLCKNITTGNIQSSPIITVASGFEVVTAGVLFGTDLTASGFFVYPASTLTNGFHITNDFSIAEVNDVQVFQAQNGLLMGGAVSSSQGLYPNVKINDAALSQIVGVGLYLDAKSVARVNNFNIEDDTGQYPSQVHLRITNPALPANPNHLSAQYLIARNDLIQFTGVTNNPPVLLGVDLSENPSSSANIFVCDVNVGFVIDPAATNMGEGANTAVGMVLFTYDGATYVNNTAFGINAAVNPISTDLATTAQINLSAPGATIDGVTPALNARILVKDGSTLNMNVAGYSVDNGIWLWLGAAVPMSRASDFTTGGQFTDKTWFSVTGGATNYGSRWKLMGSVGGINVTNITVGTTDIEMESTSFPIFSLPPTNSDILYIGSSLPLPFPGVETILTAALTTTSSAFPSSAVLTWQYYNGSTWVAIPYMVTEDQTPYTNQGDQSFGYGVAIPSPGNDVQEVRFGLLTGWSTTTINSVSAYWVRVVVLNAAAITQVPVVQQILLQTNHLSVKNDGFVAMFGTARSISRVSIPLSTLTATGTSGELAPTAIRLKGSDSPSVIATLKVNAVYGPGVTTAASWSWSPPESIDSSSFLKITGVFSHPAGLAANSVWQIDYCFVADGLGQIASSSGTSTFTSQSSGPISINMSATSGDVQNGTISLNIVGLVPSITTIWFKISRLGANVSDTYMQNIYLTSLYLDHAIWAIGKSYSAF